MRGGVGKAGGKKHFWLQTVKYNPDRYKKIGFKPPSSLEIPLETINVGELEELALRIHGLEYIKSEEIKLDLGDLGIDKLLGRGRINLPLKLKVSEYTSKALEKLEAAGGEIVEPE
jgi:large subunit ribosomal protein L15